MNRFIEKQLVITDRSVSNRTLWALTSSAKEFLNMLLISCLYLIWYIYYVSVLSFENNSDKYFFLTVSVSVFLFPTSLVKRTCLWLSVSFSLPFGLSMSVFVSVSQSHTLTLCLWLSLTITHTHTHTHTHMNTCMHSCTCTRMHTHILSHSSTHTYASCHWLC